MVTPPPPAPPPADGDSADADPADAGDLDAGDLVAWLAATRAALRGDADADVDCTDCTACCTSSQFVHVEPDETDALAHLPAALLFPAPGLPKGHVLLPYDERGHCPMLVDGRCSVYAHRPRTCRTYDCRVFPAAGIEPTEADKAEIAARVRRWRFGIASADDQARHDAVRAAATYLDGHPEVLDERGPVTDTQRAVLAVEVHTAFTRRDVGTGAVQVATPSADEVRVEIGRARRRRPT